MRFYLDENFPATIGERLRDAGHEVVRAVELHAQGTADEDLLKDAQDRSAVFLTTDKDFFHSIAVRLRPLKAPVASFTLSQPGRERLWIRTVALLRVLESDPDCKEIFLVKDWRIVRHD